MNAEWYKKSYRRNLVDMHINDWNKEFLSEFDPKRYVDLLALADVQTAYLYANSHVGLCYWPTKIGEMHGAFKGRDLLGELTKLCRARGMDVIYYYTTIFCNWPVETHPEWAVISPEGKQAWGLGDQRYGVCCPNNQGYRKFVIGQVSELCTQYAPDGIWIDMTFWPDVCYCPACQKRFKDETGRKIPRVVNWEDPVWVSFQRRREAWMADFSMTITKAVKKLDPSLSISQQGAPFHLGDWMWGGSVELSNASDYMSGDFYGDSMHQSFYTKFFYTLSENKPMEYMTSRCGPDLRYHTATRPKELLEVQMYGAFANGGTFLFIDAIDPVGTQNKDIYSMMGDIYKRAEKYEPELGGTPCADVAVYMSFESGIYLEDNGKNIKDVTHCLTYAVLTAPPCLHRQLTVKTAKALRNNHIPYTVISRKNLKELAQYRTIVLPETIVLGKEEVKAFRAYVKAGGSLIAVRHSGLIWNDGNRPGDFLLSDVLGVSYVGETKEAVTYIASTAEGRDLLKPYDGLRNPLSLSCPQVKVRAHKGAKVLATVMLPYTDPADHSRFASIHSNPPGITTKFPSIVLNKYGKGKTIYLAGDFDMVNEGAIFTRMLDLVSSKPLSLSMEAPKAVEATLFYQKEKSRYLVHVLNYQSDTPNIPIDGITVKVRLGKRKLKKLSILPNGKVLPHKMEGGYVKFTVPRLETYTLIGVEVAP